MNSEEVTVESKNVTAGLGEIATLKWSLKKGTTSQSVSVFIYRGNRKNESAFLIDGSNFRGKLSHFRQRLSGRFIGNREDKAVEFELNITNVKYGDKGMFYLLAAFGMGTQVFRNATVTLNVKGSFLIFCWQFFFRSSAI